MLDLSSAAVGSTAARNATGLTGAGIGVAVVDSGIAPHADLVTPTNRIVGWKDLINGQSSPYDDYGHGTHVAGIIAGSGGAAAKAGHDLEIEVTSWTGTLEIGEDPSQSSVGLQADGGSLRVRVGRGGIQSLGDEEKASINQTVEQEILKRSSIEFRSTAVDADPGGEQLRVRGEISGWKRHGSGHCYFALKDADAVIDAVCWRTTAVRLGIKPEDGMEVVGDITSCVHIGDAGAAPLVHQDAVVDRYSAAARNVNRWLDADTHHRKVTRQPRSAPGEHVLQPSLSPERDRTVVREKLHAVLSVDRGYHSSHVLAEHPRQWASAFEDRRHVDVHLTE